MGNDIKALVKSMTGDVALRDDVFSQEQKQVFEKVMTMCDKNPAIDWKAAPDSHNQDFCLVEKKIEPVKNFCLKTQYVAGLSMATVKDDVIGEGNDLKVISYVRVWREGIPREVVMTGASTMIECGSQRSSPNKRAFHDAVARAQTRAFKLALESYMGFPFINLAIQMVFGVYDVEKPEEEGIPEKNAGKGFATDTAEDADFDKVGSDEVAKEELERKQIVDVAWKKLKSVRGTLFTEKEVDEYAERFRANSKSMDGILAIKTEVDREIDSRRRHAAEGASGNR